MQFVSNIKSVVDINPSDLTEKVDLPTKDYAIKLEYNLNALWNGFIIPGRPRTDANYPVDADGYAIDDAGARVLNSAGRVFKGIEQESDGADPSEFFDKMQMVKTGWSNATVDGVTNGTLVSEMERVLRYLLDPSSDGSLLEADSNRPVDYAAKLSTAKITNWLQTTQNGQTHSTFFDKVFDETQVTNILEQLRNMGKYDQGTPGVEGAAAIPGTGYVKLDEGDEVGVIVCLQTSPTNIFNLHLFLKQTSTYWLAGSNNRLSSSTDGLNWYPLISPFPSYSALVTHNNRWIAMGNLAGSKYAYSEDDGSTWTHSFSTHGSFLCLSYGSGIWVAGNGTYNSKSLYYSYDGKVFVAVENFTFTGACNDIVFFDNKFVAGGHGTFNAAVGYSGTSLAYSTDGMDWTGTLTSGTCSTLATDGTIILAGLGQTLARSIDGITWDTGSIANMSITSIVWFEAASIWVAGGAVAGGAVDTLAYSEDGTNWTTLPTSFARCLSLNVLDNIVMAMFRTVSATYQYRYSYDGMNWVDTTIHDNEFTVFSTIA